VFGVQKKYYGRTVYLKATVRPELVDGVFQLKIVRASMGHIPFNQKAQGIFLGQLDSALKDFAPYFDQLATANSFVLTPTDATFQW